VQPKKPRVTLATGEVRGPEAAVILPVACVVVQLTPAVTLTIFSLDAGAVAEKPLTGVALHVVADELLAADASAETTIAPRKRILNTLRDIHPS
jgi:hypothetical protein